MYVADEKQDVVRTGHEWAQTSCTVLWKEFTAWKLYVGD